MHSRASEKEYGEGGEMNGGEMGRGPSTKHTPIVKLLKEYEKKYEYEGRWVQCTHPVWSF